MFHRCRLFNQMDVFENLCKQYLTKHSLTYLIEPADIFMFAHMDAVYTKYFPACEINCSLYGCGRVYSYFRDFCRFLHL